MKNYITFDIDRKNTHDKSILLYAYAVRLIKNGTGRAED